MWRVQKGKDGDFFEPLHSPVAARCFSKQIDFKRNPGAHKVCKACYNVQYTREHVGVYFN